MYEKRPGGLRIAHVLGQHPLRVTKGLARARGRILTEGAPGSNDVIGASHFVFHILCFTFASYLCFTLILRVHLQYSQILSGAGGATSKMLLKWCRGRLNIYSGFYKRRVLYIFIYRLKSPAFHIILTRPFSLLYYSIDPATNISCPFSPCLKNTSLHLHS